MSTLRPQLLLATCSILAGLSLGATAAPVTFGNPINIGTNLNSITQQGGTVVGAVNFGPQDTTIGQNPQIVQAGGGAQNIPTTSTVGNITFRAVNTPGSIATVTTAAAPTGTQLLSTDSGRLAAFGGNAANTTNTNFDAILNSNVFRAGAGFQITLNSLSAGASYVVQLFAIRGSTNRQTFSAPDVGSVTSGQLATETPGGQYVLGSFIASGATQVINVNFVSGTNSFVSALILRQVPEINVAKGVLPMAMLGFVGLVLMERRRFIKPV